MTTPLFNVDKSLQVVLYVSHKLRKKDFHKIFKIIYFADREHIAKYGRTITGDTYIAMKDGPVPSNIYDVFKAVRGDGFFANKAESFSKMFSVHDWLYVEPKQEANLDFLSPSDIEELDNSLIKFGDMNYTEIRDISHDVAWRATARDTQMSIEAILRESGENEEYIIHVVEQIRLQKSLH